MPRSATNDWNTFQRENKGKWDRDELIQRWNSHKHQQDAATPAVSGNSRAQQLLLLKQGIQALILSGSALRAADDVSVSTDTLQAEAAAQLTQGTSPPCDSPNSTPTSGNAALCSLYVSCSGTPDAAQSPNKQHHQQQAALQEQLLLQTPNSHHTAGDTHSKAAAGTAAAAPPRSIDISPCSNHTEPDRLSDVPVQELVKLREAVHHLLSKQTPQPQHQHQHRHDEQHHRQQQQQHQHDEHRSTPVLQPLQDRQQDSSSSHAAPAAPAVAPAAAAAAVGTGCFGRSWGSSRSKLSWNAFQKSCKGRGLTQGEISSAYRDAKQQYLVSLHTGVDPQDVDTFLQQWQHQHQHQQHQQQHVCEVQAAGGSRWSGLQQWLHSKAASRAASRACSTAVSPHSSPARQSQQDMQHPQDQRSGGQQSAVGGAGGGKRSGLQQWLHSRASSRAVSRACSTAVSPSSSPAGASHWQHPQSQGGGGKQSAVGGGSDGGGKWGALKDWLHSRSSSRAASRLGTPAASPAGAAKHLPTCSEGSCQQTGLQQQQREQQPEVASRKGLQQRQWLGRDSEDEDASYLPFANQLAAAPPQQQQLGDWEGTQELLGAEGPQQHSCSSSQQEHLCSATCSADQQQPATPTQTTAEGSSASSRHGTALAAAAAGVVGPPYALLQSRSSSSLGDGSGSLCSTSAPAAVRYQSAVGRPPSGAPVVAAAATATASTTGRAVLPSAVAAACPSIKLIGHRLARETVPDDMTGLLQGFSEWLPVVVGHIKELKRAVPQLPGLYEWGVKLPLGSSGSCSTGGQSSNGAGTIMTALQQQQQQQPAQLFGPVVAFYLGKAGTLKPQRPRRRASAYGPLGYTGETLRSRLTRYWATRSGRLGPLNEEHKTAFFQQQLQAGGRLYLRWRVCTSVEPVEAETYLLNRIDWAANYMNNRGRRPLMLQPAEPASAPC